MTLINIKAIERFEAVLESDFFRERMLDIEEKISITNKKINSINQTIANIQSQLRTLNARVRNQFSNVVIQITSKEELKVDYELSYNINDRAGWKPCFDLRIEKMNSPVDITYKAEIYQNTNEQWKNIKDFEKNIEYQTINVIETLKRACDILEPHGLVMVLEPLSFSNHPGLFLTESPQANSICKAVVGRTHVRCPPKNSIPEEGEISVFPSTIHF